MDCKDGSGAVFVCYLTNGERGQWHTAMVEAADSGEAKRIADGLRPGWRCYGVQMPLLDPAP